MQPNMEMILPEQIPTMQMLATIVVIRPAIPTIIHSIRSGIKTRLNNNTIGNLKTAETEFQRTLLHFFIIIQY